MLGALIYTLLNLLKFSYWFLMWVYPACISLYFFYIRLLCKIKKSVYFKKIII